LIRYPNQSNPPPPASEALFTPKQEVTEQLVSDTPPGTNRRGHRACWESRRRRKTVPKEKVLTLELVINPSAVDQDEPGIFERQIANYFKIADRGRPGDRWRLAGRTPTRLFVFAAAAQSPGSGGIISV
jgi:hypothetical protein